MLADTDLRLAPSAPKDEAGRPRADLRFESDPVGEKTPNRLGKIVRLKIVLVDS